jgi:hypothetical protein
MNIYMGYSRAAGSEEGAVLIFANTARQAKPLAFYSVIGELCDSYLDVAVRRLRKEPWLFKEQLKDTPHVIDDPKTCSSCHTWGQSEIGEDGFCNDCREEATHGD